MILPPDTQKSDFPTLSRDPFIFKKARTEEDFEKLQKLRFLVFYEERNISYARHDNREWEKFFDDPADHFLIIDQKNNDIAIATYRTTALHPTTDRNRLATAHEFDLNVAPGLENGFFELGRACIDKRYRNNNRVISLAFEGINLIIKKYGAVGLFGTASFFESSLEKITPILSFLQQHFLAPPEFRAQSKNNLLKKNDFSSQNLLLKECFRACPPLIKFYLKIGCKIGEGIFIDENMKTIDIFVVAHQKWLKNSFKKHIYGAT